MDYEKVCYEIAKLDSERQKEFFNEISSALSEEEIKALYIGVSYFRMIMYPELKKVIAEAIYKQLINKNN